VSAANHRPHTASQHREPLRLLAELGRALALTNTEVEFYFLHGAHLFQAFTARPGTAQINAMFQPSEVVRSAARAVAVQQRLAPAWLHATLRSALPGDATDRDYVELPGVRLFTPPPEYVLAVKCGAMRLGDDFREDQDLRYLLRAMNLESAEEAMALVSRYLNPRQLASDTKERLNVLLRS